MTEKPSWILSSDEFIALMIGGTNKAAAVFDAKVTKSNGNIVTTVDPIFWELIQNEDDRLAEPGNWVYDLDAKRPDILKEVHRFAEEATRPDNSFDPNAAIDWSDMNAKVAQYFTVRDVTNNQTARIPRSNSVKARVKGLAMELDKIREAWDGPIAVTSWYRPPHINRAVGGARFSQHIQGHAADIRPIGRSVYAFQKWLDPQWSDALGYGARRNFVHVDCRSYGGFGYGKRGSVRWNY